VLPFSPAEQQAIAAENALAATWSELWGEFFDLWGDVCLETIDMARQTQLVYEAIMGQILLIERQAEAEESARLIREVCGD
jgi:hypothetical protein